MVVVVVVMVVVVVVVVVVVLVVVVTAAVGWECRGSWEGKVDHQSLREPRLLLLLPVTTSLSLELVHGV